MKALLLINLKKLSVLGCMIFLSSFCIFSQPANLTTGGYSQNFGTSNINSWTNNVTFPGWYLTTTNAAGNPGGSFDFRGNQNVTVSSPSNSGGFYSYRCNGGNDQKIGTRPSNSSPAGVGSYLQIGLILTNTSGETIQFINVTFTAYQFSLAQNGGNINTLDFAWAKGPSINTNLVTGTYTNVPDLSFTALQSSPNNGSNQIQGYPCTQSEVITACINLGAGGLPNGSQVVLRWRDENNNQNDPHLAIDNVFITGFPAAHNPTPCASPLAVDLVNFQGSYIPHQSNLSWETQSEQNNSYFTISRSQDGLNWENIGRIQGAGNSNELLQYEFTDYSPLKGINYYRLQSTDFDGTTYNKGIVVIETENQYAYFNSLTQTIELPDNGSVEIYSLEGKLIKSLSGENSVPFNQSGVFLLYYMETGKTERIVISLR